MRAASDALSNRSPSKINVEASPTRCQVASANRWRLAPVGAVARVTCHVDYCAPNDVRTHREVRRGLPRYPGRGGISRHVAWLAAGGLADRTGPAGRRLSVGWTRRRAAQWSRQLYDAGYVGLTWPKEYGGGGAPHTFQGVFLEETARIGSPDHIGGIGLGMAGPTIIAWGSDEQKKRYLAPLLSGEEVWCQGFSEPSSGSDLAGANTRAVLDGDEWVVNGQKVWSSWAHIADWCILVVRTDPDAEKHRRAVLPARRYARPGRRGSAAQADHRRPGVQRDLLHRRPRPQGLDARPTGRGLERRDDNVAARARHPRLRVDRRAGAGGQPADRAGQDTCSGRDAAGR